MKKHFKKLVSLVLVLAMVLSMSSVAFAKPGRGSSSHGSSSGYGWSSYWNGWGQSSQTDTSATEETVTEEATVEEPAVEEATTEEAVVEETTPAEETVEEAAPVEETVEEAAPAEETVEEAAPEVSYPAVDFEKTVAGVKVSVEAPEGAFPEGTTMSVKEVTDEDVLAAVAGAADGNIVKAVDISFSDATGEIEPKKEIRVTMTADEVADVTDPVIVHVDDEMNAEVIDQADVESADDEVVFDSDKFSVYAIVDNDGTKTDLITYHFLDGEGNPYTFLNTAGETVSTQIIKDGESLQAVPAPGLLDGQAFNGWYYFENGSYGSEVKFGEPITVTETKDVYIKAHYGSVIYVTFYQYAAGKVVLERKQIPQDEDGKYKFDMSTVTVPAPKTTLKFMGWSLTAGTDASEKEGDTVGSRPLLDNGVVEFTADTEVYPVYYSGIWISFVSAEIGAGASYTDPYFLTADSTNASAAKPDDPTMTGFTFDGWYTADEGKDNYSVAEDNTHGEKFDFNTSFANLENYVNDRGEVVLYGHWRPGNTTYVVVYWKQLVNNDKNAADADKTYDYAGQTNPITAVTGSNPTPSSAQQAADTGFQYKRYQLTDGEGNNITGIAADGSSILNVYFDRKLITMNFGTQTNSTRYYTYTGLYGQTLAQNGYSWPGSYAWSYRSNGQSSGGTAYSMSYLGQFVLPTNRIPGANNTVTSVNFYNSNSSTSTIYYYIQNADGTWPTTPVGSGETAAGEIQIAEKFDGFTMDGYQYNNSGRGGNYGTWTPVSPNESEKDVRDNMAIRYRRINEEIKFLNPLNENAVLDPVTLRYGQSLSTAKPSADVTVDLGNPGYEWDGKWYKDKACTVEFDFDSETMPLGGTKVYAGKKALYFYVKFDPNGGQLLTGQRTYSWFLYNQEANTYDNIERNYIEYKGTGTPYYYYYDEFDTSRRDDIWNYEYMANNPRTAYYTDSTDAGEFQKWLDTKTQYSYEADAYALIGWYDITDGGMTPFKSGTAITKDTILQAQWRRTGEYKVVYSVEAVDESGNPLMKDDERVMGANSPADGATYADKSDSAIMDKIGKVPSGYNFVGWYYNDQVYQPGDVFQVLASKADDNKIIHIYPVMEPVETLPVEVIDITFDPNGGEFTTTADTEINAIISSVTEEETGSYKPEFVKNDDGTYSINNLKINEGLDLLSATAVQNGVTVNGEKVLGRGYRLKEWNTASDGTGTSFSLGTKVGVDGEEPLPNTVYAIWEEVFYVYHSATGEFETLVTGDTTDRWALTTGFDKNGTVNKTQYTDYYYGGFAVYATGSADAAGLTFEAGDVKTGTIADSYWTRSKAAKSADMWNASDIGAVYFLKEVPTSYLAKPASITIRDNYGAGDITNIYFISVTDTNIYRAGGIKLKGEDIRGKFSKSLTLTQNNGGTTTITPQSQFKLDGYLTVVNNGTTGGDYDACQAYWTTYDSVNVYGIEKNIKDIVID